MKSEMDYDSTVYGSARKSRLLTGSSSEAYCRLSELSRQPMPQRFAMRRGVFPIPRHGERTALSVFQMTSPTFDIPRRQMHEEPPSERRRARSQPYRANVTGNRSMLEEYNRLFFEIMSRYSDHKVYDTYGSICFSDAGCAIQSSSGALARSHSPEAAVYTAVTAATEKTQSICEGVSQRRITLCSHSLSALEALQNKFCGDPSQKKCVYLLGCRATWVRSGGPISNRSSTFSKRPHRPHSPRAL